MIGMQMVAAESKMMMMMMMSVMKAMCVCHDEAMVTVYQNWKKKNQQQLQKTKNKNHTCVHYAFMKGRVDLHILTGLEDRRVVEQKHIIMKKERKKKTAHSNHV